MKKFNLLILTLLLGQIGFSQPQQLRVISNNSSGFVKAANFVFFVTNDSLMKTNGTVSGTSLVRSGLSGINNFHESNGLLYFIKNGTELWKSDGTNSGTILLKTYVSGSIKYLSTVGSYLYFSAAETSTGHELYRTDGTVAGTILLNDIQPGSGDGFGVSKSVSNNGIFYFQATNTSNGKELWRTDGTTAGTFLLKDVRPGSVGGYEGGPWVSGGKVYFNGNNGTNGSELYITDGTTSGTIMIKDIGPGTANGFNGDTVLTSGGFQYFIGKITADSAELWKTNGTSVGTSRVKSIKKIDSEQWNIDLLYANAGNVYFLISDESIMTGYVWKSDGTAAGTLQFKTLTSHWREYKRTSLFNNGKYYVIFDRGGNFNLLVSDGTAAGTFLTTFGPDNYPQGMFAVGSQIVIGDMGQMAWEGFYKTDGTPGNGSHFTPAQYGSYGGKPLVIGDKMYFEAIDGGWHEYYEPLGDDYNQFFVSDLTTTRSVRNACGVSLAGSSNFVELNSKIIFTTYNPYKPGDITKLWIYDGNLNSCDSEPGAFTLLDSDSDSYITRIRNQMNIPLDGTVKINVKYNPVYNPGSVKFTLNEAPYSVENVAPYSLAGDNNGDFNSWNYVHSDTFTIVAKEYSGSNGTGTLLKTSSITFSIDVNSPGVYKLAINGQISGTQQIYSEEGTTIYLSHGEKVSLTAYTQGSVGSVRINYNNGALNVMENVEPYSLFGDANGILNKGTLAAGVNTIQATPYTGIHGSGIEGKTKKFTFNVVYSSPRMGDIGADLKSAVKCYPNPSSDYVDISLNEEAPDHGIVEIYDLKGESEVLFSGDLSGLKDGPLRVNTQKLNPGVYYLKITSETKNYTEKLIIR